MAHFYNNGHSMTTNHDVIDDDDDEDVGLLQLDSEMTDEGPL